MRTDADRRERGSTGRRRLRRGAIVLVVALALPVLSFFILSFLFPFPVQEIAAAKRRQASTLVLDREGRLLRPFLGEDQTWLFWGGLDEASPHLIEATVAVEDERFYRHPGVDPIAVARAAWTNLRSGRIVSGASTITMQVMRLLEQRPRTLRNKAIESFRALQMERILSKSQILEIYFNLAPYGGNLVGPEAASLSYFGKHARDLTLGEAALLAGLVQSPSRFRPDRHPERAQRRRDHVLERMQACGCISREQLEVGLKEPVARTPRIPFPCEAPHLAQMLYRRNASETILKTTLDRRIQTLAETALREGVDGLRHEGISNGAVVVMENDTAAVRALVGSCDFFSEEDLGQINGATTARSPGSALKPFIYALAFDQGLITPESILADAPANYTGYEPQNYDRLYRGPVTAREALCGSLNMPAVGLLERVGQKRCYALLKELGLATLRQDADRYGLSLALGSAEVNLLELTNAYAALARLGEFRPYRLLETQPLQPGSRAISEGAAWLVADILSDMDRLNGKPLWNSQRCQPRMAWKTGTSYGHRDAWTVAYTPEYTVGVWMGNFAGKRARGLVGVDAAAPVAARIMSLIYRENAPTWYASPACLGIRPVCAACAMALGDNCSPRILSPSSRQAYVLQENAPAPQNLLLKAASASERVYWFIDGAFYRACPPDEQTFWPLQRGAHKVVCSDEFSRSASVVVDVQ